MLAFKIRNGNSSQTAMVSFLRLFSRRYCIRQTRIKVYIESFLLVEYHYYECSESDFNRKSLLNFSLLLSPTTVKMTMLSLWSESWDRLTRQNIQVVGIRPTLHFTGCFPKQNECFRFWLRFWPRCTLVHWVFLLDFFGYASVSVDPEEH